MFQSLRESFRSRRPAKLCSGYAELQDVDQALRDAELRLSAAHMKFAKRQGPRPDSLYREVQQLRERSRTLLAELGNLLVDEDSRFPSSQFGQG